MYLNKNHVIYLTNFIFLFQIIEIETVHGKEKYLKFSNSHSNL